MLNNSPSNRLNKKTSQDYANHHHSKHEQN